MQEAFRKRRPAGGREYKQKENRSMVAILQAYGTMLLKGMGQTLLMTLLTLVIATVIGMIFGLMNVGHNRVLNLIGTVYVDAIRGVPLIVWRISYSLVFRLVCSRWA